MTAHVSVTTAERCMPRHPRGVVKLLRRASHRVVVREKARNAGLAYKLDGERERTAFYCSRPIAPASWGSSDHAPHQGVD